jgi:hypothetical protein
MSRNNALGPHNSVASFNNNSNNNLKKRLVPMPPSTPRSGPASARTVANARRFRQKALNIMRASINKLNKMTNEQFNIRVMKYMKNFKNLKNYGKLSINNIPVLIAVQNSALRRRQKWQNV